MADRFTKTVIILCLSLICCMFSYYMGYDKGLNDYVEINNRVFETASDPYKTHNYDTSKFNNSRIERFKTRTTGSVLHPAFKTEKADLPTAQNKDGKTTRKTDI